MLIRKSHLSDFDGVYQLIKELNPTQAYDEDELNFVFLKGLKSAGQIYISAIEEDKIVGFCSLSIKNSLLEAGYFAQIDELIVSSSLRRQGIGRLLMENAIKLSEEHNCKTLGLHQGLSGSDEVGRFAEQLGFTARTGLLTKQIITPEAV